MLKATRLSWEEYALALAEQAARRSEDPWVKCGAVVLRWDNSCAATGYNGVPPKISIDWSDREARRKFVLHAECNALNYVLPGEARLIAVTLSPCVECLKLIAAKRVPFVVFRTKYTTGNQYEQSLIVAKKFKIKLKQIFSN